MKTINIFFKFVFLLNFLRKVFTQLDLNTNENPDVVQILSISRVPEKDNSDRISSLEGGTLFYVKGTGFDIEVPSNNVAYIGNEYPCVIDGKQSAHYY